MSSYCSNRCTSSSEGYMYIEMDLVFGIRVGDRALQHDRAMCFGVCTRSDISCIDMKDVDRSGTRNSDRPKTYLFTNQIAWSCDAICAKCLLYGTRFSVRGCLPVFIVIWPLCPYTYNRPDDCRLTRAFFLNDDDGIEDNKGPLCCFFTEL